MSDNIVPPESSPSRPVADIQQEALRIIKHADAAGIQLRLLGGVAIALHCPSTTSDERLRRAYKDIDCVTLAKWGAKTRALFENLGYTGSKTFNALHGHQRLLFWEEEHERQVDIFIDKMQMCHTIDFRDRLSLDPRTLSLSDLLLTKLQIVEINEKDILDVMALFCDHDIVTHEPGMNADYIAGLTAHDWGLQKTLELNLQKIRQVALEQSFPEHVAQRIDALLATIAAHPKSLGWKARALVGERVQWYELPEETRR